ncbi:putative LPS assembly protein LptD [Aquipluma nitroreducens]|uniref:putative LPS assembly protein LptD n=1 Tax=Aquipluma nitroreducens TaxID=2010828 RepID=UPI00296E6DE0|nr:putative LPS assembly protein LptD [Aquipluma nitroreducens]
MIKNLLTNILFLVALSSFGQLNQKSDTISVIPVLVNDSTSILSNDSIPVLPIKESTDSVAKPLLEAIITYSAADSIIPDFENQKMYMYKNAVINYQNIELKADYIMLDLVSKEVYAEGLPDSTGTIVGTPVFKEGDEEFESKTMRYNFETQKGFITDVKTTQGDGFVHSDLTKKISKDEFILEKGKYTTCDAEHPHFYLRMTKAKVISNKKIITGPAYMVLEDFPIYFPMIPFGYFPNSTTYTSGILIPTYGEEQTRGFFLREGGYYWAASDHFDLALRGDIYSKGSWATKLHSNYKVRYKFSGSLDFSYNLNKYSEQPLPDARTTRGFSLAWSHSQDSKANPNRTFSASVNLSTSSFDKENTYMNNATSVQTYLQTQKSSSISYTKKFENSPFNMSVNLRHSQNSRDTTISLSLPELTFNMSKINPFKVKNRIGPVRWYEKISFSYSGNIKNSISNVKEKDFLKQSLIKDWQNGWQHSIPISLPSFNLLKYINLSPSFNYSERWYTSYINKRYDPNSTYVSPRTDHVMIDTIYSFRRNYNYSYSISTSTNIYGMYTMRNPNSRIKAIRHKITPSASFSYTPDFGQKKFGFWGSYIDGSGKVNYYNHFENGVFGSAGMGESGAISFNLNNNLEAKVLEVSDSIASKDEKPKYKKVKIIDISANTSYNMIADSFKLSPIGISARTTIKGISVNMGANLNPYMVNSAGRVIDEYVWSHKNGLNKLGRLTNANMSFGMNFDSKKEKPAAETDKNKSPEEKTVKSDEPEYVVFNMPWSFRFDYSFYYNKTYVYNSTTKIAKPTTTINQSLNFGGKLSLTDKWQLDMNTNFDVQAMKFSFTTVNVSRTLHCWTMSFNFVPFGDRKSYSFNLSASSAILRDLKVSKQSSWRDN